ncbi:MAG TPA: STAS domain-containing protein [Terriglobales bacterium]|nr:STAS domain-containing protein [Terriglobales bacterium]
MLQFVIERSGDMVVLQCRGRMVAGEGLNAFLRTATAQRGKTLVIDLRGADAVDAAGLGTLLRIRQWCDAQAMSLKLTNLNKHVREVLGLTALDSVMEVGTSKTASEDDGLLREWACAEN